MILVVVLFTDENEYPRICCVNKFVRLSAVVALLTEMKGETEAWISFF